MGDIVLKEIHKLLISTFTPILMGVNKWIKETITNFCKDIKKPEPLYINGENMKWCRHTNSMTASQKVKQLSCDLTIPILGKCPRKLKTYVHTKLWSKTEVKQF